MNLRLLEMNYYLIPLFHFLLVILDPIKRQFGKKKISHQKNYQLTKVFYTAPVSPQKALCCEPAGHGGIQCNYFFDHSTYVLTALRE